MFVAVVDVVLDEKDDKVDEVGTMKPDTADVPMIRAPKAQIERKIFFLGKRSTKVPANRLQNRVAMVMPANNIP